MKTRQWWRFCCPACNKTLPLIKKKTVHCGWCGKHFSWKAMQHLRTNPLEKASPELCDRIERELLACEYEDMAKLIRR